MEFFRIRKDIPFMKHALVFNVISLVTFLLAVFFLATKGLHFSVEFTGGTLMEVSYSEPPALEKLREALAKEGYADAQVQNFGSSRDVLIRLPNRDGIETAKVSEKVIASLGAIEGPKPEMRRVEFVGPQVGKELDPTAPWPCCWSSAASCSTSPCASNGASPCRPSSPTSTT